MRPSIKRLELESWVTHDADMQEEIGEEEAKADPYYCLGKERYPEIPPRFNKDGMYFDRHSNVCWMEYNGRAWKDIKCHMKYTLQVANWEILTEREEKALTEICKITRDTVLKKTLQKRLYEHTQHRYLNDLRRGVERRNGKPVSTYSRKLRS